MTNDNPPPGAAVEAALEALAAELAAATSRQYRISEPEAKARILQTWQPLRTLHEAVLQAASLAKAKRTRAYRDAAAAAKKAIYYELRRYRPRDDAHAAVVSEMQSTTVDRTRMDELVRTLVAQHVSTVERLPHLPAFLDQLVALLGETASIIDIGAGVFPLVFPFARVPALSRYCAADRDSASVRAVDAYARWRGDGILHATEWDLADGWGALQDGCGIGRFDVVLMLKLVPLLQRQDPQLLEQLAGVPARRAVITGSRQAMAKRNVIARRELRLIDQFIDRHGFARLRELETPDELGYYVDLGRA